MHSGTLLVVQWLRLRSSNAANNNKNKTKDNWCIPMECQGAFKKVMLHNDVGSV